MLRIVAKARELLAPADVALEPLRFADKVSAHADELRAKLTRGRVDARDSLAYLESHEAQHGERRTVAGERPAGCQRCNGTKIIPVDYDADLGIIDGPCPDCKPPEAAPPEVATDALNKLLADTANGWRSGGALHIAFTEDIRANLARQAEAHERKLGAVKSDLKLWTEKLDEAERRLRIVNTDIEGVWFWQGDGHDDPVSLACPVVMSADTLREMVAQAEAHAREAQLPVARLIEDLAKKVGCLVTRLDTKKQGSK